MPARYYSFSFVHIRSIRILLVLVVAALLASGCRDKDDRLVPRIATDITLNLNLPEYNTLINPGGWLYLTGGSRGVIVYRVSNDEFVAFDRHCTYNVPERCRVSMEDTDVTLKDEDCCGSVFDLFTGGVLEGPAQRGLQSFRTFYSSGTNTLRIFN